VPNGPTNEQEEVARKCGLRLLEISGIYEQGVVGYEAGHETLSIGGLVARQRRLLRAAYLLADEGQRLEASIMLRAMLEFLIRQKWLESDPGLHFVLWAADDLRARLRIDRELRENAPDAHDAALEVMEPEVRQLYAREFARMREQLEVLQAERGLDRLPSYPTLREQAEAVGMGTSYSLAYRFDSLSAAHPSPMAIEQLFEDRPDLGGIRLMPEPPPGRTYADPYSVGAFILRDALAAAAALVPEFQLDGFDEIVGRLEEVVPRPPEDDAD
jgi:Family of unknown function (DUF5677)